MRKMNKIIIAFGIVVMALFLIILGVIDSMLSISKAMSKWWCKEIQDGFAKWFKLFCYGCGALWLLDLLPKLPDELAAPIAERIVGLVK